MSRKTDHALRAGPHGDPLPCARKQDSRVLYRMLAFTVRRGRCGGALAQFQPGAVAGNALPFRIGKVLTMWGMEPEDVRGMHAHHRTEEIVVALRGGCRFDLDDGRGARARVRLCAPALRAPRTVRALLLYPRVWRTFHSFLPDTLLLVVANMSYDEKDYLRDRADFEDYARRWKGLGGSYGRRFLEDGKPSTAGSDGQRP